MNGKLELKLETSKTAKTILCERDAWMGIGMGMKETVRPVGWLDIHIHMMLRLFYMLLLSLSRDIVCCDDDDDMLYDNIV